MIEEYIFRLVTKRHQHWKYLRQEFLEDDSMTLEEAALAEFNLFIKAAPTCVGEPLESVTMYGYENSMCVGILASHQF